jgi:hypothetical protein
LEISVNEQPGFFKSNKLSENSFQFKGKNLHYYVALYPTIPLSPHSKSI